MSGPRIGTLSSSGGGGRGAQPAAANPGGPGGAPQNWLQEWQERTPFVTRWAIYITLPLSLLCLLWEAAYNALSNSPRTFLAFELWRPITALPNSGSALDLPFTLLMLAMTGPSTERALGSSRFASFMLLMGVIINVHYSLIMAIILSSGDGAVSFAWNWLGGGTTMFRVSGLWPVFLAMITANSLADPGGTSRCFCVTLQNRIYPWFLLAVFCLLSFAIRVDLVLGVAIGHLYAWGKLRCLSPSTARVARWEADAGILGRAGLVQKPGWVAIGAAQLPEGGQAGAGAAAGQGGGGAFAGFSIFGGRGAGAQAGAAAPNAGAAAAGGGNGRNFGGGAVGGGTSSSAAGGPRIARVHDAAPAVAGTAGAAGGAAAQPASFAGSGNRLGSGGGASSSVPVPSAPAATQAGDPAAAIRAAAQARAAAAKRLQEQQAAAKSASSPPTAGTTNDRASLLHVAGAAGGTADPASVIDDAPFAVSVAPIAPSSSSSSSSAYTGGRAHTLQSGSAAAAASSAAAGSKPVLPPGLAFSADDDADDDSFALAAGAAPAATKAASTRAAAAGSAPPRAPASAPPARAAGTALTGDALELKLVQLASLGFDDRDAAEAALRDCEGDVDMAALLLAS